MTSSKKVVPSRASLVQEDTKLKETLVQEKEIEGFLQKAGSVSSPSRPNLEDTYKMLKDKEMKIREELEKTQDLEKNRA